MILEFAGYEVNIKAKALGNKAYNPGDTARLVSLISIAFAEAGCFNKREYHNDPGRMRAASQIFKALYAADAIDRYLLDMDYYADDLKGGDET